MSRRAFSPRVLRAIFNLYPPYLGAGVRVTRLDDDFRAVDVEMRLTRLNRNYVGTHFGGSLYSMVDPFYMLMIMHNLGGHYVVWDQSASIHFKRPGTGRVRASFRIDDALLSHLRAGAAGGEKVLHPLAVDVVDDEGELVAAVEKTIYVRLTPARRPARDDVPASTSRSARADDHS